MNRRGYLFLGLAIALAGLQTARADSYDAVSDFTAGSNPSGAWSYLYASSVGSALTPLTAASNLAGVGIPFFSDGQSVPTSVVVARNTTGSTASYETIVQPTDLLEVDPESLVADVRWTAPAAGTYSVSGLFQGIDTVSEQHAVEILSNYNAASPLLDSPLAGYSTQVFFDFDGTYSAGDTLDFLVAYTGNYAFLSTGFDATITSLGSASPVPLPAASIGGRLLIGFLAIGQAIRARRIQA